MSISKQFIRKFMKFAICCNSVLGIICQF